MAYRRKAIHILKYKPDIIVVSECEHPDKLIFPNDCKNPSDVIWHGDNLNKGLGVFSYSNYRFELLSQHAPEIKNILPIKVTGGKIDFILFAIWANHPRDKPYQYVGQVWKAMHYYEDLFTELPTILTGDFNSNSIWDRKKRDFDHTRVVNHLAQKNITSCYHKYFKQEQGKEKHPTQYMYRHKDKPYHLDYCFASGILVSKLKKVSVGSHSEWCEYSDHCPVITTFLDRGDTCSQVSPLSI